ncbi:9-divinyl ether synthase [Solanum tuberosum]|uniref:Divinyl ether synthase CYP74D2 n=1 Tax=Solanum tuberosum TaxID=4113 RepID=DES_SOLTU|nr:9-divinyl ether synthase [Solanum tuberosum]Q9AVQ1.1 RecName: Full=9-divinyl ether synthase; Short=StDES; AltName: Full=Colneleate synthase; AltName: Full=Cytochrome P450 74D2 [Solanum tuberosum]CAC28152.1 divinyl ether synthase [Solanum tuberosum]
MSSYSELSNLPIREIPGDYGFPIISAIKDRYDYFYNQGEDAWFHNKAEKYKSTVVKINMAPGPFTSNDYKLVAFLDANSFVCMFDNSLIDKTDTLGGTFKPGKEYYSGYRPVAFIDTKDPNHAALKGYILSAFAKRHNLFIPLFRNSLSDHLFNNLEKQVTEQGKSDFNALLPTMTFNFIFRLLCDQTNPSDTVLGAQGPEHLRKWLFPQLIPSLSAKKLPNIIEDTLFHNFLIPFGFIKSDYNKLVDAFSKSAVSILDEAEKLGIKREEAVQNILFLVGINMFAGLNAFSPHLFRFVGEAGASLHTQLAKEIRTVIKEEGGAITLSAINKMSLVKSVVYETLRLRPPVPLQYGKAKKDFMVQSHDASYKINKGQFVVGYQPMASRDPKIFANPDEFVPDRFMNDGEKMLKHVLWSNGRETENPAPDNKQCPGKDLVHLLGRLILVEFFMRYDTFTVEITPLFRAPNVAFKTLTKASK